jgi:excisionase family DNA binding protein
MSAPPNQAELALTLSDALLETIARRAAALVLDALRQNKEQDSPYMTIPEAAAYARCKRQRIDDLLSSRRLSRHKDGRRTLILRAELEAHLAATSGPASRPGSDSILAADRATVTSPGNRSSR